MTRVRERSQLLISENELHFFFFFLFNGYGNIILLYLSFFEGTRNEFEYTKHFTETAKKI